MSVIPALPAQVSRIAETALAAHTVHAWSASRSDKGEPAVRKIPLCAMPVIAAAALLAAGGSVSALTTPPPDRAVMALGTLAPADLDVTKGPGKAFLASLFPGQNDPCPLPAAQNPDFDGACMWSKDDNEEDFDLLIGIEDHAVVSVVTSWPRQLDAQIWACEPIDPATADNFLNVCSVQSATPARRAHWAASWRAFLNAVN
ncbi:hypothetical protein [Novosphingobium resinovorum]|uniref:hypothetical protein n=1 Tax=Novosphingobium resinovorum TaxID=158500 RepID=UPI002ED45F14|nr:hypothetical protein [Novosphingobium resinovorum]